MRTDVRIGDTVLFYTATNRKSAPRWRGPATILDVDEAGAATKFQFQTFQVARYCVREKVEGKWRGGGGMKPGVESVEIHGRGAMGSPQHWEPYKGDGSGGGWGRLGNQYGDSRGQLPSFSGSDTRSGLSLVIGASTLGALSFCSVCLSDEG